ncbi:hypothetical protein [Nostoc phage NMeng1]|nr:hypothetical protein [Nostoc phage NMeng1]
MTDAVKDVTAEAKTVVSDGVITNDKLKELLSKVTDNPASLEFPTDRWGFTSEIKKVVLKRAASVRGQEDKHSMLLATMAILMAHIKARYPKDKERFAQMLADVEAAAQERAPRERVSAPAVAE